MTNHRVIQSSDLESWESNREDVNRLLENIVTHNSLKTLTSQNSCAMNHNHLFSDTVKPHLAITNQKASGRCWIFAALNIVRREMIDHFKLSNFEFSQNYLFFWDKLERFNYNLDVVLGNNVEIGDELWRHILQDPISDGGQWDMIVNIVEKYGLLPKTCYKDTFHSGRSIEMNNILKKKFRKAVYTLKKDENKEETKKTIMEDVYKTLCLFLGTPPKSFVWEYQDKDKKYHRSTHNSPLEFYRDIVPFNFKDYLCVIHDPRQNHPYNSTYTVKHLGNVIGGNPVLYLNLEIRKIKELVEKSIKDNKAVWFGCDVGQHLHRDKCAMDFDLVDYKNILQTNLEMTKEERLLTHESLMTHAMCITGLNLVDEYHHVADKWQVENSWGKADAAEGYYIMTDKWFDQYVYEIAINKKYLDKEQLEMIENNPTILNPWDPMGSLAV